MEEALVTPPSSEDSLTPPSMYSWRVAALRTWLGEKSRGGAAITMEMLNRAGHLDQLHYQGVRANDDIITLLQVQPADRLLDMGSGLGGPARYIASKTGCSVDGFDIQEDLVEEASKVAGLVGLAGRVRFTTTDACSPEFAATVAKTPGGSYDAHYSILVNLHIPRAPRRAMLANIGRAVKETGAIVIEDYVLRTNEPLLEHELRQLTDIVGVAYLPTKQEYKVTWHNLTFHPSAQAQLEEVGFVGVEVEDMTEVWLGFTQARERQFLADKQRFIELYGLASYTMMETFYTTVPRMFEGGRLGGARITASKLGNRRLARGRRALAEQARVAEGRDAPALCIGGKYD